MRAEAAACNAHMSKELCAACDMAAATAVLTRAPDKRVSVPAALMILLVIRSVGISTMQAGSNSCARQAGRRAAAARATGADPTPARSALRYRPRPLAQAGTKAGSPCENGRAI